MSPATAGARMGKSAEEGQQLMDNFFAQFPKVRELMDASMADLIKNGYVEDWAGRRRHLPDINLPNYEVRALRESKEANFNPFLECEDRGSSLDPEKSKKWWAEINKTIEKSQEAQKKRDPNFKGNEEMSNMKFESLAKEAIKDGVLLVANTGRKAQAQRQCLNARIQGGAASLTKLAMVNVDRDPELLDLDAHLVITVHDEVLVECPMAYAEMVEKRLPQVMIDTAKPFINVPMACDPYAERQWYIGEYSVSIQAEYKKLEQKGIDKETALAKVIANHPEMFPDAIRATIETGEEIDADAFADIIEDIEEFELVEPEVEETEEEEADSYVSLFN